MIPENCPFLSAASFMDDTFVGIIQNSDSNFVFMYVYNDIRTVEERQEFIRLGEVWWWETNRQLPINLFLKKDFRQFKYVLRQFSKKEMTVMSGPEVSVSNAVSRRTKRKQIKLVKNV